MASDEEQLLKRPCRAPVFRWPSSMSKPSSAFASVAKTRTKRRKLPWVRLGGKSGNRGGFSLGGAFRWLRLRYRSMIKRLKSKYSSIVKDLIEAGATLEEVQKRIMLDMYFAIPVVRIGAAGVGVPSHVGTPSSRLSK